MDYKLYCNGYQIDISQYPLLNVYGEPGEPDIVYISEKNYSVMEILGLYIDYNEFYTRDYLEKNRGWITVERAVKLASVFSKAKKGDIDVQYDKDGGQLIMKNGGSTVTPPVAVVVLPVVVFDDGAYVRYDEFLDGLGVCRRLNVAKNLHLGRFLICLSLWPEN
jgi:hypothetical protein